MRRSRCWPSCRDLAGFQNRLAEFEARLSSLQAQYAGRPAFQERLRRRGWFETFVRGQLGVPLRMRIGVVRGQALMGCCRNKPVIGREE